MNRLLDITEAAAYCCNLPVQFLRNQIRLGRGPAYLKVSPHRIYFQAPDLDAWMATWQCAQADRRGD
jgi:hypothetical protein